MKKFNLILSSLTLAGLLTFAGCDNNKTSSSNAISSSTNTSTIVSSSSSSTSLINEKHTVTFVLNNGEENKTRKIGHNKLIMMPEYEKEFFVIEGWYTDEECVKEKWNFDADPVTEDITLYANWVVDYQDWIWRLGRLASKQTIMLYVVHDVPGIGKPAGFGSGVVISQEIDPTDNQEYFYALTNNHVVSYEDPKTEQVVVYPRQITIYDHYQNQYSAELLANESAFDLALVKFKTTPDKYGVAGDFADPDFEGGQYRVRVAEFAENDPEVGADVSSYGSPIGQMGVCTVGKVHSYGAGRISPDGGSSCIEFDNVIHHDASILSGNSGGPLFDPALKLVGINYGSSGSNDTYLTSGDFFAIPISRVREFIKTYVVDVYNGQYDFLGEL